MRRFAPVEDLLLGILRPALTGATVGTLIPATMPYPFVLGRRAGGGSADPRFLDSPLVDVQVWATSDKAAADVSADARFALVTAWRAQTVVPGVGSIGRFADQSGPALLPGDDVPHGVYRYQATYDLVIRSV